MKLINIYEEQIFVYFCFLHFFCFDNRKKALDETIKALIH